MDAVCGEENWGVLFAEDKGNILASLPYYIIDTPEGGKEIRKAPLTQNNGIKYYYPKGLKYENRLSFEMKAAAKIIEQIESLDIVRYRQYFHYSITNWLPFYWEGYSQSTRYTYVIEDTSDIEGVEQGYAPKLRNQIRKAQRVLTIYDNISTDEFYVLNRQSFLRQGIDIPYSKDLFINVHDALKSRGECRMFCTVDHDDRIHSAVFLAEDVDSVYYLMSGSDPAYRDSQSLSYLLSESIRYTASVGKKFDFEGTMKKNIESFFRSFGAVQKQYFDISKAFEGKR
jgi:hypothetical protein